jgi:hypothetical protein
MATSSAALIALTKLDAPTCTRDEFRGAVAAALVKERHNNTVVDPQIGGYVQQLLRCDDALARALGDAALHDGARFDEHTRRPIKQQRFSVADACVLAERLSHMSASATDWLERAGASFAAPPAPLDTSMHQSRLHLSLAQLLAGEGARPPPAAAAVAVPVATAPPVVAVAAAAAAAAAVAVVDDFADDSDDSERE